MAFSFQKLRKRAIYLWDMKTNHGMKGSRGFGSEEGKEGKCHSVSTYLPGTVLSTAV